MSLRDDATALRPQLAQLRRELHRIPEVGLHLPETQRHVLAALDGLPLEVSTGRNVSSVTAVLRGDRPGPVVLLRADMDALPVAERPGEPFASRRDGLMHACGHDLHLAGLVPVSLSGGPFRAENRVGSRTAAAGLESVSGVGRPLTSCLLGSCEVVG
jgi:hippurate hydrolase